MIRSFPTDKTGIHDRVPDAEECRAMLARLVGIEDRVELELDGCKSIWPIVDLPSAVRFLRFGQGPSQIEVLKGGIGARIDDENYRV